MCRMSKKIFLEYVIMFLKILAPLAFEAEGFFVVVGYGPWGRGNTSLITPDLPGKKDSSCQRMDHRSHLPTFSQARVR